MREYFVDEIKGIPFQMFGIPHLILIMITIICFVIIVKNNKLISNIPNLIKNKIALFTAIIMLVNMIIYYLAYICYGVYDWKVHLPLHLCFICGFIYIFTLITKNFNLYKITYFMGYIGPIPAIIFTDLRSIDSYVFIQFIISHHFFLLSNLFIYYAYNIKINKLDMLKAFMLLNTIFFIVIGFNELFGTNYIMVKSLPETLLIKFTFLKQINDPFWLLEGTGILMFILSYVVVYFKNKEENSTEINQIKIYGDKVFSSNIQ